MVQTIVIGPNFVDKTAKFISMCKSAEKCIHCECERLITPTSYTDFAKGTISSVQCPNPDDYVADLSSFVDRTPFDKGVTIDQVALIYAMNVRYDKTWDGEEFVDGAFNA